jgi:hypothetical protein
MRTKKTNKTEEIRRIAREMIDNGKPPRPLEVVGALKKKGIHVVGSQVSMALRGTGMEFRPQTRTIPDLGTAIKKVQPEDISAAQEYLRKLGDRDRAIAALVVAGQMEQT